MVNRSDFPSLRMELFRQNDAYAGRVRTYTPKPGLLHFVSGQDFELKSNVSEMGNPLGKPFSPKNNSKEG